MDHEPLGYQHYLYDVEIEYSPGGNRTNAHSNRHCFRLKYLPYMVHEQLHTNSNYTSSNDSSISDQQATTTQDIKSAVSVDSRHVDVTKTYCAFLGNYDYVPTNRLERRRVVLELISAKLSQSTTYNPSLVTVSELPNNSPNPIITSRRRSDISGTNSYSSHNHLLSPTSTPVSSRRFVNYTLLIKTVPGLDKQPAVIERRFSDFHNLYQGLKSNERTAALLDRHITFPKKIYMGNFSLTNIAERSIEFARLLDLCMTRPGLLWSVPFISFLLDKELKEAYRLSLCGDPDDVQALIETTYYIQKKLYIRYSVRGSNTNSLVSSDEHMNDRYSPTLPSGSTIANSSSSSCNGAVSGAAVDGGNSIISNANDGDPNSDASSSPNMSISNRDDELADSSCLFKTGMTPLNQRILVTFCMLFITYYRVENYEDLRVAVQGFSQLISTQDYIDSIINTQHYMTLRACLLFLMNMNQGNVIEVNQRLWFKRKLEDIDGAVAELDDTLRNRSTGLNSTDTESTNNQQKANGYMNGQNSNRIHREDLTSLMRDRDFCSFQDTK